MLEDRKKESRGRVGEQEVKPELGSGVMGREGTRMTEVILPLKEREPSVDFEKFSVMFELLCYCSSENRLLRHREGRW